MKTHEQLEAEQERKDRIKRHGDVWVQFACAAILSPREYADTRELRKLSPVEIADRHLEAFQENEAAGWPPSPNTEDGDIQEIEE